MKATFHISCVHANGDDIHSMVERGRDISHTTFKRRCEWEPIAQALGYATGKPTRQNRDLLRLENDWCVRFYKSLYQGEPCYYMVHSAIEYVFI